MRRTLLLVALLACSDDEPAAPLPLCTGNLVVEVGAGTTPVISWTPRCLVHRISVYQPLASPREAWRLRSPTGIAPGVRYGAEIRGATTTLGPVVLSAGVEAAAELSVEIDGTSTPIAGRTFTP